MYDFIMSYVDKLKAVKCSDYRIINLIAHTAKIVGRVLKRRMERKIGDVLGDQFEFGKGRGIRNALGMLRIVSELTLEIDQELCACFLDFQKAFDHANGPN